MATFKYIDSATGQSLCSASMKLAGNPRTYVIAEELDTHQQLPSPVHHLRPFSTPESRRPATLNSCPLLHVDLQLLSRFHHDLGAALAALLVIVRLSGSALLTFARALAYLGHETL